MNTLGDHDITGEKSTLEESSSAVNMPVRKSKKEDWHIAALFLFFLYEKGHLRGKTQSKNEIRKLYNSDFKTEFLKTDPSLISREFPSLFVIIVLYLERRLLLRMVGVDSDILRFHNQNVQTFLKIYHKKVLFKTVEENSNSLNDRVNKTDDNENSKKASSRRRKAQKFYDQRFAFKLIEKFGDQVKDIKPVEKYHCSNCNITASSFNELRSHYQEDQHLIRYNYQKNRKELVSTYHEIQINLTDSVGIKKADEISELLFPNGNTTETNKIIQITGKDEVIGILGLTILNLYPSEIVITNVLRNSKGFEIVSIDNQDQSDNMNILSIILPKTLSRGSSARMNVMLSIKTIGRNDYFIFFKIFKDGKYAFIMQKLSISVESDFTIDDSSPPVQQGEWKKPIEKSYIIDSNVVVRSRGPRKKKSEGGTSKTKDYPMPRGLVNVLNNGFRPFRGMTPEEDNLRREIWELLGSQLSTENYRRYFSILLFIEHHQMSVDILKYRLHDVPLLASSSPSLLALDVPGLAEKRPSVLRGDSIMITIKDQGGVEFEGRVHKIENTRVLLKFSPKLMAIFLPNMKVDVRFDFSRRPHNLQHEALETITQRGLLPYICFPTKYDVFPSNPSIISWFNRNVENNDRQREAVINITNGTSRPAPYLLFGPPGTGKTVTVVETILQILRKNENVHILVTAPSNAAVDVISSRLLNSMPPSQLMRIYSPCREMSQVPEALKKSCNYSFSTDSFEIPKKYEEILKYKVISLTMITAGRLVSLNMPLDHFSHIFIDECGQGLEPEALISVAGLFYSDQKGKKPPTGQLVLSGDPLQLGPVLRSPIAKKFGLEMSLLERLMKSVEIYQRDGDTMQYNPKVLTKLVKNFRSHPAILKIPNELFYQGELQPSGDVGMTHSACNWDLLPKKGIPVIFHGVQGREERDNHSPSYFNTSEIHQVVFYLKEILNSKFSGAKIPAKEIGIISPYRRQVEKIKNSIAKNSIGRDITVASVEEFQGQERRVIIISTVRSDPQKINLDRKFRLGFLREPKRFNVAVTRAKALLIIIGNPNVLQGDPCWGELLRHCYKMGCYTGIRFTLVQNDSDEEEEDGCEDDDDMLPGGSRTPVNEKESSELNAVIDVLKKLSVKTDDVSAVTKMIEPPWESHE